MGRRDSTSESEIDHNSVSCNSDEAYYAETASVASTISRDENCDNGLVVEDLSKFNPSFGRISVANCNDVHFGNKAFYHGPVTIKQFLCAADGKCINDESAVAENDSVYKICDRASLPVPSAAECSKSNSYITNNESKNKAEQAESWQGTGWIHDLPRKHIIFIILLSIVLVLSLVISTAVLLTRNPISIANDILGGHSTEERDSEEIFGERPKDNETYPVPTKLRFMSRGEWVAQPPTRPLPALKLPVPYVIILHTATEPCNDQGSCALLVRTIQMYHIESKRWWDIGLNFLVGGDGYVYEGRGWKSQGAHTYGYDDTSIGIALVGTFNSVLPPPHQIWSTKKLIERGVKLGHITKNYKLVGARQLYDTDDPGKLLFEEIKSWDNWSNKV